MKPDSPHTDAHDDSASDPINAFGVHFSARRLARDSVYNIAGRVLPLLVALVTIPFLIDGLGVERFGVLTLAWLTVGYFGIFDLGIGRATTKFVAETVAKRDFDQLSTMVWTPLLMLMVLGIAAGVTAFALIPWLVEDVLNIPPNLQEESRRAFLMLAVSVPFVLGTSGARGVLEGQHRFALVNALRVPASSFTFIAPLVVMLISNDLFHIVAALVAGRAIGFVLHLYACLRSLPSRWTPRLPERALARSLLSFGGWLTVANLIGSLVAFGYIDRFIISSLLDLKAVTYYSTPFEAVTKLLLPVAGFMGVLFPTFSAYALNHKDKLRKLHTHSIKFLLTCLAPVILPLIALAGPGLNLWLGQEFVRESTLLMQLMTCGVLISGLSSVPAGAIQALGRPDLMARQVLIELPVYAIATILCTIEWGAIGTASVWVAWQVVHTVILFVMDYRLLPPTAPGYPAAITRLVGGVVVLAAAGFACAAIDNLLTRVVVTLGSIIVLFVVYWKWLLDQENRTRILGLLGVARQIPISEQEGA